jgi:hypothetical protein
MQLSVWSDVMSLERGKTGRIKVFRLIDSLKLLNTPPCTYFGKTLYLVRQFTVVFGFRLVAAAFILIFLLSGCTVQNGLHIKTFNNASQAVKDKELQPYLLQQLSDDIYSLVRKQVQDITLSQVTQWVNSSLELLDDELLQGKYEVHSYVSLVLGQSAINMPTKQASGKSLENLQKSFSIPLNWLRENGGTPDGETWQVRLALEFNEWKPASGALAEALERKGVTALIPDRGAYAIAAYSYMAGTSIVDPSSLNLGLEPSIPFTYEGDTAKSLIYVETLIYDGWKIIKYNRGAGYQDFLLSKDHVTSRVIMLDGSMKVFYDLGGSL